MIRRFLVIALAIGLAGCLGTETGNPPATAQLGVDTHSSNPAAVSVREERGGIVVDEAWLALERLALVPAESCETMDVFPGAKLEAADHANPEPAFVDLEAESDSFCALRVRFVASAIVPAGAPSELSDHAIVIRGRRADGTPFEIWSRASIDVAVRSIEGSFALPEDESMRGLFLGFDVATWLSDIGLGETSPDLDGMIKVSSEHNADVLDAFESNLASGLELFRDADLDGRPDPGSLLGRGGL